MQNQLLSIDDLIGLGRGKSVDEDSATATFATKQKQIQIKHEEKLAKQQAANLGLPYIDLFGFPISSDGLSLLPEEKSIALQAVIFYYDGDNFRIATTKPTKELFAIVEEIKAERFCAGQVYFVSERSIKYGLDLYKMMPKVEKIVGGVKIDPAELEKFAKDIVNFRSLNDIINKVNISDVVTLIIATAMKIGTSDIHIEAEEKGIVVRLRVDGVLQEAALIESKKWPRIISRMKLLAKVKLNVTSKPQDGRYTIFMPNENIAVRSSFLPTVYGESVVMRLLRSSSVGLSFEALGLSDQAFNLLAEEIAKPNGLILTTGPTGSGKTTTLYAILNKLNEPGVKIITLEDPIEYQLAGINQSQVDSAKGYNFADGLRSILRQDPDIVMVGEIRDFETAEIAVQASLTGHIVLSTLHTNDAAGVIPRLIDMGVKPFFLTPSINAVIGQRLVRKLCQSCRVPKELNQEEMEMVGKILAVISPNAGVDIPATLPPLYKAGTGCPNCLNVGYKGRIGIYEIFSMTNDIKELTNQGAPAFKILEKTIENGMVTMLQDGVLKALSGMTDLDEVYRVIGKFDYINALYDIVVSQTIGRGVKISMEQERIAQSLVRNIAGVGDALRHVQTKEMLNVVLALAAKIGAGDVHVDPSEAGVKLRLRIDGVMTDIVELGKEHYIPLISNIKNFAGFAMSVKKATYDGRFSIVMEKTRLDCRVSIISGGYGETAVIRLLSGDSGALDMSRLGIRNSALNALTESMSRTKGMIITTGPTGSGKTTTLYSILGKLNNPNLKIITIEDPIEYHMDGVMQTQIDVEGGYTFDAALRSLLRQNPNVIMVGEIRDEETAKTAVEAATTGHLMLSTIHTNSAAGAIARFVGLGVERQMLASALECVVGQRLVRRICVHCKVEYTPEEKVVNEVKKILATLKPSPDYIIPSSLHFYKGEGCPECGGLGYKGRIGLYEVIKMTASIQKVIQQIAVTDSEIEAAAMAEGTVLMVQDGVLKVLEGETTLDEIFRTVK